MDRKIKILVISNYNSAVVSRPEAEIFLGLSKRDYEITVMTYDGSEYTNRFREAGIRVIDFHPEKKFNRGEIRIISDELKSGGYDILMLFNSEAIYNGIQAAKGIDVRVVLYRGYSANVNWFDPTDYLKFLHPRVDHIICNSIGVKEMFDRQLFFRKDKAVVINKGHDVSWYDKEEALDIKSELGIPEESFLLVSVANNRRMKGIPYLLKGFIGLPENTSIHLLLVGRDMDTSGNLKLIQGAHNEKNVHFVGYRNDSLRVVKACDVFVLASLFGESITKSVIEAMSLGVAPIITDIAGNRELVVDGENGLVVPKANSSAITEAILKLYNDRELSAQFGANSRKRIQTALSKEETVENYDRFYRSIVFS